MAICQNAILVKCQSPQFLLLLHFSMNLSETFRIDVNMASYGQYCAHEPKTTLKLWVHIQAIAPNP